MAKMNLASENQKRSSLNFRMKSSCFSTKSPDISSTQTATETPKPTMICRESTLHLGLIIMAVVTTVSTVHQDYMWGLAPFKNVFSRYFSEYLS